MQRGETPLEKAVVEDPAHAFVARAARSQTVAVAQAKGLGPNLHHIRLLQAPHAQLFKIVIGPDVVVALEEAHLYAGIHKGNQGRQHFHIALRHYVAVLVPEVPDIAQKIQRLRLGRVDPPQKGHEGLLPRGRVSHLEAQMDVGDKVCQCFRHEISRLATLARNDRKKGSE